MRGHGKNAALAQQWRWPLVLAAALLLSAARIVPAQQPVTPAAEPIPWRQNVFSIPYHVKPSAAQPPAEVLLYVSKDRGQTWELAARAEPRLLGFTFRAPHDGEYWFSLRTVDDQGSLSPEGPHQPELRVTVDTVAPRLDVSARRGASGQIELNWESVDPELLANSLKIEYQTDTDPTWRQLAIGAASASAQYTRSGRSAWWPPEQAERVALRAEVFDRAGNRSVSQTELDVSGGAAYPLASGGPATSGEPDSQFRPITLPRDGQSTAPLDGRPQAYGPSSQPDTSRSPFDVRPGAAHPWPTSSGATPGSPLAQTPTTDPFAASRGFEEIPLPSADRSTAPLTSDHDFAPESVAPPPADPPIAPYSTSPLAGPPYTEEIPPGTTAGARMLETSRSLPESGARLVNSRQFDLDYDVESVGPSGIAKVELWGTADGGQSWQNYGLDDDQRSPFRVTVPGEGVYGFRIVVENGGGLGDVAPQSGDLPDESIGVDLTPPQASLISAQPGDGNQTDQLIIRWEASDAQLATRPVALFWRPEGEGAWRTVASSLENTGQYAWRLEREVPDRFLLRLDVRDAAGNVQSITSEEPVIVLRPRPKGHIRGVRPAGTAARQSTWPR
ncbi:MAG: Ig-like domain repeat protein [Pirellulales bacterium]